MRVRKKRRKRQVRRMIMVRLKRAGNEDLGYWKMKINIWKPKCICINVAYTCTGNMLLLSKLFNHFLRSFYVILFFPFSASHFLLPLVLSHFDGYYQLATPTFALLHQTVFIIITIHTIVHLILIFSIIEMNGWEWSY